MTILIALGSNRPHGEYGPPRKVLTAAVAALETRHVHVSRLSPVCVTEPIGPGTRRYANAVAAVETALQPEALLETLHHIERAFGRKRWRRWGDRVLDLDLIAYEQQVLPGRFGWRKERSGGVRSGLILPHPDMHRRAFVLRPAVTVAANWRHPVFGLTIQQMWVRHRAPRQSLR